MNSIRQELEEFRNHISDAAKKAAHGNIADAQGSAKKASEVKERVVERFERLVEKPAPVVWRDGAVEKWYPVCTSDRLSGFYRITKGINDKEPRWSSDIHGWRWDEMLWLPADEFPMPALPAPVIEPCPFPFCGGECQVEFSIVSSGIGIKADMHYVKCKDCSYRGPAFSQSQQAIDAHNSLCQRLK